MAAAFFGAGLLADGSTSFLAPDTTPLNSAPGRNLGSLVALIFTASPVRGLRPMRALRALDSKTPKPLTATLLPLATAFLVSCRKASTMSVTSFLLWPRRFDTLSIRSALFTSCTPPEGVRKSTVWPTSETYVRSSVFALRRAEHSLALQGILVTLDYWVTGLNAGRLDSNSVMASACCKVIPMSSRPSIKRQRT